MIGDLIKDRKNRHGKKRERPMKIEVRLGLYIHMPSNA